MNGSAATLLYLRHAAAIEAHCNQLLRSPAEASDAVHETFVRVLSRRAAPLSEEHAVRSLFRISTHVCIDLLRQRRVRRRALPELTSRARDRERESQTGEPASVERMLELLAGNDPLSRSIVAMHFIEGRKRTEIAQALGTSRRTVYGRLKRVAERVGELRASG
jgi:RNA polymerase sigma-70 factor (ECF subfamily)